MTRVALTGFCVAALCGGCAPVDMSKPPTDHTVTGGPASTMEPPVGACAHTTDHFSFTLTGLGGHTYGCGAEPGKVHLSAMVIGADTDSALLVTSPLGKGWGETIELSVTSQDFAVPLFVGAFVHVEVDVIATGDGCAQALLVQNLPSFVGLPNPITADPILWIAGADGTLVTSSDSPFHVADVAGCGSGSRPGYLDDEIAFTYSEAAGVMPTTANVGMGVSYFAKVPGHGGGNPQTPGGDAWLIRNLRSFHTAGAPLGDPRDFAYWVTHVTPELP